MTSPAVTIRPGRSVAEAATLMLDLGIDRLLVVDGEELVGIVTRSNLVRAFIREDSEIEREIRQAGLLRRLCVDPDEVEVTVTEGNVLLAGRLETSEQAESLIDFVDRTPGVVSVESRLT